MPEPMVLAQGCISLDRTPTQIAVPIDHVPVFIRNDSVFATDPPDIAVFEKPNIGEDQRVRLVRPQLLDDASKIVDVTSAAGAIEPELLQLTVYLYQFVEFGRVILVI